MSTHFTYPIYVLKFLTNVKLCLHTFAKCDFSPSWLVNLSNLSRQSHFIFSLGIGIQQFVEFSLLTCQFFSPSICTEFPCWDLQNYHSGITLCMSNLLKWNCDMSNLCFSLIIDIQILGSIFYTFFKHQKVHIYTIKCTFTQKYLK